MCLEGSGRNHSCTWNASLSGISGGSAFPSVQTWPNLGHYNRIYQFRAPPDACAIWFPSEGSPASTCAAGLRQCKLDASWLGIWLHVVGFGGKTITALGMPPLYALKQTPSFATCVSWMASNSSLWGAMSCLYPHQETGLRELPAKLLSCACRCAQSTRGTPSSAANVCVLDRPIHKIGDSPAIFCLYMCLLRVGGGILTSSRISDDPLVR